MVVEGATEGLLERPTAASLGPSATAVHGPPPASPVQDVPMGPHAGIMSVMATTRAMRHLAPDPVPYELLRTVIEAATWATRALMCLGHRVRIRLTGRRP
jgi:hypothetical protein